MQEYHIERVRLLDDTTAWYAERGQTHTHTRLPHVYERYTEGKGKGKANKGSRNHRLADGKGSKGRDQHQEDQAPSKWGPYYDSQTKPWHAKAKSKSINQRYDQKQDDWDRPEETKQGMGPWRNNEEPQYRDEWDEEPQLVTDSTLTRNPTSRTPLRRRGGTKGPVTEQPRDRTWSYNYDCKTCGNWLKYAETSKRSGNCNKCHHGASDSTQDPTSSYSTRPTTAGYGGEEEEKRKDSYGNERKLGGYGGDEDDSYWYGASHKRGNVAPWKGQTSSK